MKSSKKGLQVEILQRIRCTVLFKAAIELVIYSNTISGAMHHSISTPQKIPGKGWALKEERTGKRFFFLEKQKEFLEVRYIA